MPVFARTKLTIHDDCLAPAPGSVMPGREYITLSYTGPNPQNIYFQIKKLFSTIFKAEEREIQEKEFFWDTSKPEQVFKVKFEMVKDFDVFTFMQVNVDLSGTAKPSREFGKEGHAEIRIEGWLRTEYPQDTLWQRSLFYEFFRVLHYKLIYKDTRQKYKERCVELINHFQSELKSFLNILPRMR
jgi:hypothetical protein